MPAKSSFPASKAIPNSAPIPFPAVTFLITWGTIGAFILSPDMAVRTYGEISGSHPLFFRATWSPAIAGFLVIYLYGGLPGLGAFLWRRLMWRGSWRGAAFILLLIPLVFVAGSLSKGGPMLAPLPPEGVGAVMAVLFMMLFLGPVAEFGWRGALQPMAQRHRRPPARQPEE